MDSDPPENPFPRSCNGCFGTKGLMQEPVCDCAGSADICIKCLRNTILSRDDYAPTDDSGYPLCPICMTSYRNIGYRWRPNTITFNEYLLRNAGLSLSTPIVYSTFYAIFIGMFVSAIFLAPLRESRWSTLLRFYLCTLFLYLVFMWNGPLVAMWRYMYRLYRGYQNRPPRVITHVINQIELRDFTVIKIPEVDDGNQIIPMPQPPPLPPPELPIPPARPPFVQPQLIGPRGLSRRGKWWGKQQQNLPQPPTRHIQGHGHTPRRSWTQQPPSKHQRRQQ